MRTHNAARVPSYEGSYALCGISLAERHRALDGPHFFHVLQESHSDLAGVLSVQSLGCVFRICWEPSGSGFVDILRARLAAVLESKQPKTPLAGHVAADCFALVPVDLGLGSRWQGLSCHITKGRHSSQENRVHRQGANPPLASGPDAKALRCPRDAAPNLLLGKTLRDN